MTCQRAILRIMQLVRHMALELPSAPINHANRVTTHPSPFHFMCPNDLFCACFVSFIFYYFIIHNKTEIAIACIGTQLVAFKGVRWTVYGLCTR